MMGDKENARIINQCDFCGCTSANPELIIGTLTNFIVLQAVNATDI